MANKLLIKTNRKQSTNQSSLLPYGKNPWQPLREESPSPGCQQGPSDSAGIRVKQGIWEDYSSRCQTQKSPFLYYLLCWEVFITSHCVPCRTVPSTLLPAPLNNREKGEGSRWSVRHAVDVASEMFFSMATSFKEHSPASRLLRGVFEMSLVTSCVQSVGILKSPGKQSYSPVAGGARHPTGTIGL